ncbi:toxin-antitoxin system YwqK family antitoxin [Aequorivita capsosiphonis]|uniref:toxin-antitoxin system YwqK family antitoxin n=1 Tax=Aequorivita capsosiphonis TaxID=487317 RepID=UPI0004086308|nr:toxin-antitoxin system YwqK family antitoxin [Aequorivita capsosiphonis]
MRFQYLFHCGLFFILALFAATSFAQPGDYSLYQVPSDTIWEKNQILVLNASKDTLEISKIKNGKKHGVQKLFRGNGNLSAIAHFKKGLLSGKKEYFQRDGSRQIIEHYKSIPKDDKSVLDGVRKVYQNDEVLVDKTNYKNGKKDGQYWLYNPNGSLREKGRFKNGLHINKKKTYDASGILLRDENFIIHTNEEGKEVSVLDGRIKYFYNNGNISSDCYYKKGKKEGICKEYNKNKTNSLKSEISYKNDLQHGPYSNFGYDGKPQRKGIFYQEIMVNDSILKNVYEGEIIVYQQNGMKERVEHWRNYKKNGPLESFFHKSGELYKRENYTDDLKDGMEERWDKEGNLVYQAYFEIVEVDQKRISQQTGTETTWQDGALKKKAEWKNGLLNGVLNVYYANGQLEKTMFYKDGVLDGKLENFYENGSLHQDFNYQSNAKDSKYIGWNKTYDENGKISRRFYAKGDGDNIIEENFENGLRKSLNVIGVFKLDFFPEQKLADVLWMNNSSHPLYGYDFFSNQQLRRIHFIAEDDYNLQTASLTQNGKVVQVLTNGRFEEEKQKKLIKTSAEITKKSNPQWFTEDLVTTAETKGKHHWKYADGSPFFSIEFDKGLPNGKWIVYDAVSKDTLIHYEFEHGKPVGTWLKKKSGGIVMSSQEYYPNHRVKEAFLYDEFGKLIRKSTNDSLGKTDLNFEYYPNGKLKELQNYSNNTSLHLEATGDTLSSNLLSIRKDTIRISKSFYSGNRLRNVREINLRTGEGESKAYFENGQMRTFHQMKDDEPNGVYELYDEAGKLLTRGHFKSRKRDGEWINFNVNGKDEILHYNEGEIIIFAEDEADCACYDRSLPNEQIKFAQTLSSVSDYKKIASYFPDYLLPFEDLNYDKIFFINFRSDNDQSAGHSSMKLLLFKEFSFYLPLAKHIKINLNPCKTEGYISNFDVNFNYYYNKNEIIYGSLQPNRIAISLENSPLKSSSNNKEFTGYFDTKSINLRKEKLDVNYATDKNACFTPGIIKDFIKVEVIKAEPRIEPELTSWHPRTSDFPLIKNEIDRFYGFEITEAKLQFTYTNNEKNIHLKAKTTEMLAGSNFVAAEIEIEGKTAGENKFIPNNSIEIINFEDLKRFLESKGFYRIRINFSEEKQKLILQFYSEN